MDDLNDAEVMPRPPRTHQPAVPAPLAPTPAPAPAPVDAASLILEQLQRAGELHQRFLAAQAGAGPGTPSPAPARTASTVVDPHGWYLDRAGRMTAGTVLHQVLELWPHQDGVLDAALTFTGELPAPGERLASSLTVTGPTVRGTVDGRLSLRGDLVDALDQRPPAERSGETFGAEAVAAFAEGRPADCFPGPAWTVAHSHVRSPGLGTRRTLLLREVTGFTPEGGLTATGRALPPVWRAPAALFEGCCQALAFQLTATGGTATRDGWRFEPLPRETVRLRCVLNPPAGTPRYHLSVRSLTDTSVQADVVGTVGDRVVLRVEGLALRLVPDTPLAHWRLLGPPAVQHTGDPVPYGVLAGLRGHDDPAAVTVDGVRYDHATLLATAWGSLAEAFPGASDDGFRLPGPPYLFVTRLTEVSATRGAPRTGSRLVAEYEVPERVWFREQSGTVPVAVLLEAALQPCGLLAAFLTDGDANRQLRIRNLDGRLTTVRQVPPGVRSLRTSVELVASDRWDGTVLETFQLYCEADGAPVLEGTTVFALTPGTELGDQMGLPVTPEDRARLARPCDLPVIDLRARPARYFGHSARLPGPMLLVLDRITGYWPQGGPAGLGSVRAECDVRPDAWYFKAHFLNDPVQPGSLGIEAMGQLLCWYLVERGVGDGFRFEPVVPDTWTYRGQVVPTDTLVTVELDVREVELGKDGGYAEAETRLWVDGRRAYHVPRLRVRVVPGAPEAPATVDTVLDPRADTWLSDHCPTWTVPALPLMSTADLLARAAGDQAGRPVRVLGDLSVRRWLPVTGPTRLRTTCEEGTARLAVWHEAGHLSRYAPVAAATVGFVPPPRPARFAPLPDLVDVPDPYGNADLFHGRSFQYLTALRTAPTGSSGVLDAGRGLVPRGTLHQGLLDAALHVIPHNDLHHWDRTIRPGRLAFPHGLARLAVFEPLPDQGEVEVEARYAGALPDDLVAVDVQLCREERVLVAFRVLEVHVDAGPLAGVPGRDRRAYLRDRRPDPRLLLTGADGVLHRRDVERIDALPGTANALYDLPPDTRATDWLPHIALKEHLARTTGVHPGTVRVTDLDGVQVDDDSATVRTS
ncbi:hypothetical protein [Streptomyces sp. NPDC005438]|uniref:hypothetical protein n=1 Tax=Streptomyces sp. NPDC005438 TaxID=3156880 RepID=UPI0033B9B631